MFKLMPGDVFIQNERVFVVLWRYNDEDVGVICIRLRGPGRSDFWNRYEWETPVDRQLVFVRPENGIVYRNGVRMFVEKVA